MINLNEVFETNKMIHEMNLDVRTITIGISLLDCVGATLEEVKENIYNKITTVAKDLVIEIRLLTIGIPNSFSISFPVFTRSFATVVILL